MSQQSNQQNHQIEDLLNESRNEQQHLLEQAEDLREDHFNSRQKPQPYSQDALTTHHYSFMTPCKKNLSKESISKGSNHGYHSILAKQIQAKTLFIRCMTWQRDSHGLFDYESKHTTRQNLRTQTNAQILRTGNEITLVAPDYSLPSQRTDTSENKENCWPRPNGNSQAGDQQQNQLERILLRINQNHLTKEYSIEHAYKQESLLLSSDEEDNNSDRVWLVVRALRNDNKENYDYKLKKFDLLKLGRVKFRVKDLNWEKQQPDMEELRVAELREAKQVISLHQQTKKDDEENLLANKTGNSPSNNTYQCRFCWGTDSTEENPCIVPCKCSGTVGFIHYQCLQNWLMSKMIKKETEDFMSLYWKNFECEICKYPYPYSFKVNQNVYKLVQFETPASGKYLVMESLALEKNTSRMVHILNFSNRTQLNMGRGHESEVRVNDISVSRCHTIIKYTEDGIFIKDNNSKFGTLVLIRQNSFPLKEKYSYAFQVGRSCCSFTVQDVCDIKKKQQRIMAKDLVGKDQQVVLTATENNQHQQQQQIEITGQKIELNHPHTEAQQMEVAPQQYNQSNELVQFQGISSAQRQANMQQIQQIFRMNSPENQLPSHSNDLLDNSQGSHNQNSQQQFSPPHFLQQHMPVSPPSEEDDVPDEEDEGMANGGEMIEEDDEDDEEIEAEIEEHEDQLIEFLEQEGGLLDEQIQQNDNQNNQEAAQNLALRNREQLEQVDESEDMAIDG